MLKTLINSLEEVEPALRSFYNEQDGEAGKKVYILATDESDYKKRLNEFRDSNINLKKQTEQLQAEIDAKKATDSELEKLKAELQKKQDDQLLAEGKLEEVVKNRLKATSDDYEARLQEAQKRATEFENNAKIMQSTLNGIKVQDEITKAVSSIGVLKPGALTDVLSRAASTWQVSDNGSLEAFTSEGKPIYSAKGDSTLKVDEWATQLLTNAPYLFEKSSGGGGRGSSSGNTGTGAKYIHANDKEAFGANLEEIASGKVNVVVEN